MINIKRKIQTKITCSLRVARFLRWLFKAEGMQVDIAPEKWDMLSGMGSGARKAWEPLGLPATTMLWRPAQSWADSLARHTTSMT